MVSVMVVLVCIPTNNVERLRFRLSSLWYVMFSVRGRICKFSETGLKSSGGEMYCGRQG